jgi:hypothetical protein
MKHVPNLPGGQKSTDIEWIDHLKSGKDWIFFTLDRKILRNPAEKAALKGAGLHGFILASGFMKIALNETAAIILWKWPEIDNIVRSVDPAIYEIQISRQARLKPITY